MNFARNLFPFPEVLGVQSSSIGNVMICPSDPEKYGFGTNFGYFYTPRLPIPSSGVQLNCIGNITFRPSNREKLWI
jgi:hypothetical protein